MIEIDQALDLSETVGYLRQLRIQEALLGSQHLQVGGVAVRHQEGGALQRSPE